MLKIQNLTKKYGDKKAVDNLSLEIKPGEICAFIGHNGAGKTTTLKACMGILGFDEGEILIKGKSIRETPLECKKILAYIPDNPELYDYLSGIKYLNFIADVYGVGREERSEKSSSRRSSIKASKRFSIANSSFLVSTKRVAHRAAKVNRKLVFLYRPRRFLTAT